MAATATENEVMQLETQYRDAMKAGDTRTLERLTADPCIVVGAQGVTEYKRSQLAGMMSSQDFKLKSFTMDNSQRTFRQLGDGVAAVAYKVHEEFDRGGRAQNADAYNSSVWVKKGANWECAVHTETLIGQPR